MFGGKARYDLSLVLFLVGSPSYSNMSGEVISSTWCVVLQPLVPTAPGGNQPYLYFFIITNDPRYLQ
jgi:hypothetical protein